MGTTTTQVVISELSVRNQMRRGAIPRLEIDKRTVVYASEPQLTPLDSPDQIDVRRLVTLVREEYRAAQVTPADIETGAVIITGETARTKNADAILAGLGDLAGEFVVTVAGPNQESQMAGRGSGAAAWSAEHFATVVNVDLGGGSANAAIFRCGQHLGSAAAMVGGRQIVIDPSTLKITHIAPAGQKIIDACSLNLVVGVQPDLEELRKFTDQMAEITVDLVCGIDSEMARMVALTAPLHLPESVAAVFVSGGVGASYYESAPVNTLKEVARFCDVGPLYAASLRDNPRWQQMRIERPDQTLRATVLGAASQQVSLSGSTIWAEGKYLPIRNAPVIEPRLIDIVPGLDDAAAIARALLDGVQRWDRAGREASEIVIALDLPDRLGYAQLSAIAQGVAAFAAAALPPSRPLVIVTQADYAQVLGQSITQLSASLPLIVVDQIQLGEGDFIDIGEPLFGGSIVPVSVKTLVFYQ